jgi:hypothetical protein
MADFKAYLSSKWTLNFSGMRSENNTNRESKANGFGGRTLEPVASVVTLGFDRVRRRSHLDIEKSGSK